MSIESDVYTALTGNGALAALVGARIYPVHVPQEPTLPVIVYQRISSSHQGGLTSGGRGTSRVLLQFDIYADSYGETRDISHALQNAMLSASTFSAHVQDDIDGPLESTVDLFRATVDISVWAAD